MKNQLTELEDINDYSKKFHHDKNPYADSEHLDHTELLAYVKRTLNVLQGVIMLVNYLSGQTYFVHSFY